jgi:hypothetical protein
VPEPLVPEPEPLVPEPEPQLPAQLFLPVFSQRPLAALRLWIPMPPLPDKQTK